MNISILSRLYIAHLGWMQNCRHGSGSSCEENITRDQLVTVAWIIGQIFYLNKNWCRLAHNQHGAIFFQTALLVTSLRSASFCWPTWEGFDHKVHEEFNPILLKEITNLFIKFLKMLLQCDTEASLRCSFQPNTLENPITKNCCGFSLHYIQSAFSCLCESKQFKQTHDLILR